MFWVCLGRMSWKLIINLQYLEMKSFLPFTMTAADKHSFFPLLDCCLVKHLELLTFQLARHHPIQVLWSLWRRSSLTLGQYSLFIFPLLSTVRDMNSNTPATKISATEIARHWHAAGSKLTELGCNFAHSLHCSRLCELWRHTDGGTMWKVGKLRNWSNWNVGKPDWWENYIVYCSVRNCGKGH